MEKSNGKEKTAPDKPKKDKKRTNGFEEWGGYMAAKKKKLVSQFENQRASAAGHENDNNSKIFDGISIYVNGYTNPSADELKRLMMLHGGTYHYYYTSNTTFMVASNLPDSKVKSLKMEKVITPDWVVDCIRAGKIIPYHNYLLYSPEIKDKQMRLGHKIQATSSSRATSQRQTTQMSSNYPSETAAKMSQNKKVDSRFTDSSNEKLNVNRAKKSPNSKNTSPSKVAEIREENNHPAIRAGDPGFISEFYSHSRLHHISTAGQELKLYVQNLACERKGKPFPGRTKIQTLLHEGMLEESGVYGQKHIMHIDMDCFFVSVGLKKFPELRGHPVAVAHSRGGKGSTSHHNHGNDDDDDADLAGESSSVLKSSDDFGSRSEIACCSYEARKAGLRNGMYLGEALKLCPQLKTIPYDFEEYSKVSKQLYDIVASYTLDIEAVSCDELFIDCSELLNEVRISPSDFAALLRKEILEITGCTASAGIGRNMLLARLATRVAKPNGHYVLFESNELEFMKQQKVEDLPGVGYSTKHRLHELGIYTCSDLQHLSLAKLQQEFGSKNGQSIFDHCRGKDDKVVSLDKDRKSVSAEINYGIRFEKNQDIYEFVHELAVEVHQRLENIDKKGRSITLKLKVRRQDAPKQTAKFMGHGICDNISKSVILKSPTNDSEIISNECCTLARSLKIAPEDYRGVGIQVGKLEPCNFDTKGTKIMDSFLSKDTKNCASAGGTSRRTPEKSSRSNDLENENSKTSPRRKTQQATASVSRRVTLLPDELDQSVLDALPEDIRIEVLAAYAGQQEAFGNPSNSASIQKASSANRKIQSGSTRGRKSKAALKLPPQNTLDWYMKTDNKSPSPAPPSPCSCVDREEQPVEIPLVYGKAHLGGATNIDEVRSLVREWVNSAEVPGEDDIEQFRDYLLHLIDEDLEKMNFVLKYFYRTVNAANMLWKEAYLLVLSYVQQKMLQEFGYMLKAETKF